MREERSTSVLPATGLKLAAYGVNEALAAHVEYYWSADVTDPPASISIVPDSLVDIAVALDAPVRGWIAPPRGEAEVFVHRERTRLIGASLRAPAAAVVLGVPQERLTREPVALDTLCGDAGAALCTHLAEMRDLHERLALLDAFFIARLAITRTDARLASALETLVRQERDGDVVEIGTAGTHQVSHAFDTWVGMGPKRFARIVRLELALRRMRANPDQDLSALAIDLGFADHAHFSREMRAFAGLSPAEIAARYRAQAQKFKR